MSRVSRTLALCVLVAPLIAACSADEAASNANRTVSGTFTAKVLRHGSPEALALGRRLAGEVLVLPDRDVAVVDVHWQIAPRGAEAGATSCETDLVVTHPAAWGQFAGTLGSRLQGGVTPVMRDAVATHADTFAGVTAAGLDAGPAPGIDSFAASPDASGDARIYFDLDPSAPTAPSDAVRADASVRAAFGCDGRAVSVAPLAEQ